MKHFYRKETTVTDEQKTPEENTHAEMKDRRPPLALSTGQEEDDKAQAKVEFYRGIQAMRKAGKARPK